jgi:hypothetical protein
VDEACKGELINRERSMKMTHLLVFSAFLALAPAAVLAAPPECVPPGQGNPPGQGGNGNGNGNGGNGKEKVTLLHCGCAADATRMEFVQISVSQNSKGHGKHVAGSIDSCAADGENYLDFVRNGSDCQIDGPAVEGIAFCSDQVVGQECGSEVID